LSVLVAICYCYSCGGYNIVICFDSTAGRRAFDCLSKVIKVTMSEPVSRSHADLFIYLGCNAAAQNR